MLWWEALLLVAGGAVAGAINAAAGGGSILTVPLLVLAGVPGNQANASNRVGILTSNAAAATAFRRLGVRGLRRSLLVLVPMLSGSFVGSTLVTRLTDGQFERAFGLIMLPIVFLSIRPPRVRHGGRPWPKPVTVAVFLAVGIYAGAFQAGVGLLMVGALAHAGYDLVAANNVKVVANLLVTIVALPVFILDGQVVWAPALVLAAGFTAGGYMGAHAAVKGGDRLIRIVMVGAALLLAGKLLGFYG